MATFAVQGQQPGDNLPLRVRKELMAVNYKAGGSLGTPRATYWLVFFWVRGNSLTPSKDLRQH